MAIEIGANTVVADNCDDALALTLRRVLESGHRMETCRVGESKRRGSTEIIGYQVQVNSPRDRILQNTAKKLNIVSAVARFVWMIAGSDRLRDIAFYEPKVQGYTDNGISVPGSNYGMRLFQARPGLNQIEGVIGRLREESGSRRTAAVVWTPEDAVRESNDIPCAFGMFYHLRSGVLITTTIMRSNNAFILLPYNTFEFGLVGEIIAASAGAELGPYIHYAASMHVYDEEREASEKVIREYETLTRGTPMPPMPTDPSPLQQAYELAKLEAELRHDEDISDQSSSALLKRGTERLHEYWLAFYRVLLSHALVRLKRFDVANELCAEIPSYFRDGVAFNIKKAEESEKAANREIGKPRQLTFPNDDKDSGASHISAANIADAFAPTLDEERELISQLDAVVDEIDASGDTPVTLKEYQALRKSVIYNRPISVAARSEHTAEAGPEDRFRLSREAVKYELERVRKARN